MTQSDRGHTAIEMVVASTLIVLLVAVLGLVLDVAEVAVAHVAADAASAAQTRRVLEELERRIRSARSVGWCPSARAGAKFTTPAPMCTHVAEYRGWPADAPVPGGPVMYADSSQLWFWDFGESATTGLAVPDCTRVSKTPSNDLLVETWPATGTFTTAGCAGVTFSPSSPPFVGSRARESRYAGHGTTVITGTDRNGTTAVSPDAIALVTLATSNVSVVVAVRATAYEAERRWDAG